MILFSILTFVNHFSLTIPLLQQQYEQQKWNSSLTKKKSTDIEDHQWSCTTSPQKVKQRSEGPLFQKNQKLEKQQKSREKDPTPKVSSLPTYPNSSLSLSLCLCLCLSLHLKSLVHSWNSKDTFMELSNKFQSFLSLFFSQSFSSFLINCRSLLFATPFLESLNKVPVFHS